MKVFLVGTNPSGSLAMSLTDFDQTSAFERCCRIAAQQPDAEWQITTAESLRAAGQVT